jgi:ABC-type polysaccharide/polyol phosphate transport system ATPase subunit
MPLASLTTAAENGVTNATVSLQGVSKSYKLYDKPFAFLKEALTGRSYHRDKVVLTDISLTLRRGEILGIVGRNGAGKSTLLKIIAGTLSPTRGKVFVNGRVAAILELGTGFNPNYSGRDNVILSALMRGMSEQAIKKKFDSIVAFAGLEDVIDEPFHTYSNGMQARLAFAAATAVEADVIIIDEALAAGDIRFASKSLRRIHEICQSGVTALFVSHTMYQVMQLCTRAIWIDGGRIRMDGEPIEVARAYEYEMLQAVARDEGQAISFASAGSDTIADGARERGSLPAPQLASKSATEALSEPNSPADREGISPTEPIREGGEGLSRGSDHDLMPARVPQEPVSVAEIASCREFATAARICPEFAPIGAASPEERYRGASADRRCTDAQGSQVRHLSPPQFRICEIRFVDKDGRRTNIFRFGEVMRLQVAYEPLSPGCSGTRCGLAATFDRVDDLEPVMHFSTNFVCGADGNKLSERLAGQVEVEAVIDPIQLRAGEYYVSLGLTDHTPGSDDKFYEYLLRKYRVKILANGFDEPAIFYPIVYWSNQADT